MFPEWMGDSWTLVWFTCGALITSHAVSFFLHHRVARLLLAYAALFMGGTALLTSFHSASSAVNAAKLEITSDRLNRAGAELLEALSSAEEIICGLKFEKGSTSPPNFDEIEKTRHEICEMFKRTKSYAISDWDMKHSAFNPPDIGLASVTDEVWKQWVDDLQRVRDAHGKALSEVSDLQPQSWLLWTVLEPYIISASWSLGLALMIPARRRINNQSS